MTASARSVIAFLLVITVSSSGNPVLHGPGDDGLPFLTDQLLLQSRDSSLQPVRIEEHSYFQRAQEAHPTDAITLSLQADVSRIQKLADHARRWQGPINAAILVRSDDEMMKARHFVEFADEDVKRLVDIHLATNPVPMHPYPINTMRNLGLKNIQTEWTFLIDVDEDTIFDMATHLKEIRTVMEQDKTINPEKAVFVSTSYQWSERHLEHGPRTKQELIRDYEGHDVVEKHPEWLVAYQHPDAKFDVWKSMSSAKKVEWVDWYEPYFIAKTGSIPLFDGRFSGFGFNAHQQTFDMAVKGQQFLILPNVFNFAYETAKEALKTSERGDVIGREAAALFWSERGHSIGCDQCLPGECFKNCVGEHMKNKQVLREISTKVPANVETPEEIIVSLDKHKTVAGSHPVVVKEVTVSPQEQSTTHSNPVPATRIEVTKEHNPPSRIKKTDNPVTRVHVATEKSPTAPRVNNVEQHRKHVASTTTVVSQKKETNASSSRHEGAIVPDEKEGDIPHVSAFGRVSSWRGAVRPRTVSKPSQH